MSDDGKQSLVLIAMIGNVFSPWYAAARRRDPQASPLGFCAMNVAIYGERRAAWSLTERGAREVARDAASIAIGPSSMRWEGGSIVARIDERTAPFGGRIRGTVRLHPTVSTDAPIALDEGGCHAWWPVAPVARVEVDLPEPGVRWSGRGYHDQNRGSEPLERAFAGWTWTRAELGGGRSAIAYDVIERDGVERSRGRVLDAQGRGSDLPASRWSDLPRTGWRMDRRVRSEGQAPARLVRTLEDTPFYARSLVDTGLAGERVVGVHETVSLDRFSAGWVRFLLPFRMGRAA